MRYERLLASLLVLVVPLLATSCVYKKESKSVETGPPVIEQPQHHVTIESN